MPKMSGLEATRQIRKFDKEVIIIAQIAFGLSYDKEKAIEAGFSIIPFAPRKLGSFSLLWSPPALALNKYICFFDQEGVRPN